MAINSYYSFPQTAVDAFCDATIQALNSLSAVSLVRENSTLKKGTAPNRDVTSVVSFVGYRDGYFSISLSQSFADKILGTTIEKKTRDSNGQTEDEAGQLASRITGNARVQLQAQDYEIFPTTITTFLGKTEKIPRTKGGSPILIPFRTGDGNFYLEVDF